MLIYAGWYNAYVHHLLAAVAAWFSRSKTVPMAAEPADRQELLEQLRTLRERRAASAAQHRHEGETLTARWREMQTAADAIHHQINRLQHEEFCSSLDHTAAEDRLLEQIKAKSSMSLELFLAELDAELDRVTRAEDVVLPSADRNYLTGKKTMGISTDAPSRKRRAAALHAARARASAMQSEPLTIAAMNTEILALRKSIPSLEQQTIFNERAATLAAV